MTTRRTVRVAAVLAGLAAAGCVERRFVIESNVPNAQVYIDDRPVGAAPAYAPFDYYGYYTITVVHPGYETYSRRVHFAAPWYAYPPFDLLADISPYTFRDVRRHYAELHEAPRTRVDDLLNNADALRQRGQTLPSPERPAIPKDRQPQPQPGIGPPVGPGPGVPDPMVPGVGPGVSGGPPAGVVPGVGPAGP